MSQQTTEFSRGQSSFVRQFHRVVFGDGAGLRCVGGMRYLISMNWHEVIDERNFAMDQVIAEVLHRDPAKLKLVVDWIQQRLADPEYSMHSKDALTEWLTLIQAEGMNGVLTVLRDRSEYATRIRQNSPFAVIMPQDERRRILQRYEARRPRTHLAGV